MTAQILKIDDYRPTPAGPMALYLRAAFHVWLGLFMAAMIPAILIERARR